MEATAKLKVGYLKFLQGYYLDHKDTFHDLVENGQHPKTLLISCADSRVEPSIILQNEPGEIFAIRNVGNLVPPHENDTHYHGVSSALEYAVKVLKVENIMIMGHAHCGAIQAAIDTENDPDKLGTEFVHHWVDIAHEVFKNPCCCADSIKSGKRIPREIEYASIVNSMNNLLTFDFVNERVENKELKIYGLHFDIESGQLRAYDRKSGEFGPL
ncbi:Carbonic anhydrase [Candidatus Terasakiella magnetica]|uniref:Carbonic anhydrase n=1 Tax=Candidatus Terasakiella magnetica TaxID=1867952 RepID=A0A1C3REJ2_9PROT|nr:carbonic anhydrase [Candidatus Terasakiella magnetica]SCA55644.1 Carbonic anhydrase [Candidatus Terasakiella magnetica]